MEKIISRRVPFQLYYLFCISEDIYALFIHNGAERFNGKLLWSRAANCRPKHKVFYRCKGAKIRCGGMNFIPPRPFFRYIMFF